MGEALEAAEEEVLVERRAPVLWVTFNRPQARNAMTWGMYDRLVRTCEEVNADPGVKAVLPGSAGGAREPG